MGFVTQFAVAVPGNCCRMICELGARSIVFLVVAPQRDLGKNRCTVRGWVREVAGRESEPSAAVLDSQPIRTSEQGGRGATMEPRTVWT